MSKVSITLTTSQFALGLLLVIYFCRHSFLTALKQSHIKVSRPYSVTHLKCSPIFECSVGSKNGSQKYTCLQEIGLRAQNVLTIIDSIVNLIGGDLYDHQMRIESSL
jgi:hypothetical protein